MWFLAAYCLPLIWFASYSQTFGWITSLALILRGTENNQSQIVFHENIALAGQNVILVDDAIESGGTMKRIVEFLLANYAMKSLAIATLFVKPNRVDIPVTQYFAYEMDNDDLLVGYGLPWQDKLRNVPFVSKLVK